MTISIEEVTAISNFKQLEKLAKDLNIKINDDDKGVNIRSKIIAALSKEVKTEIIEPEALQGELLSSTSKLRTFTYIGGGTDSPQVTNFMGQVAFTRGIPVSIDDTPKNAHIIKKLLGNGTFVEGGIDTQTLINMDESARALAERKKREDEIENQKEIKRRGPK